MAKTGGGSAPPRPRAVPPMITLPPRSSVDTFFTGLSPGPMTIVSNFFSDHYPDADLSSFSQLLAGALASPTPPHPLLYHDSSPKESDCENDHGGYTLNGTMDLGITPSPSGFLPPLQALSHVSYINFIQPEDCPSLPASEEESQTTQMSDLEDSQIESLNNVSVFRSDNMNQRPAASVAKPASDGYNWRKYGQKQVKASEQPRTYYKCTQSNCPVKKKIGHSLDGSISDIVYKGLHNHGPPQLHKQAKDHRGAAAIDQHKLFVEESVAVNEQVNHRTTNEEEGHEPKPKRRNTEVESVDWIHPSSVMVTEPKIVVQTRSEVDILDDGFKWRKYGQKVVKGNTNPRSYYRCTYAGCNVRKHVERPSSDPKSVVTTYEGKHQHDIPVAAKRSSLKETNFKAERPVLLQLKEEKTAA